MFTLFTVIYHHTSTTSTRQAWEIKMVKLYTAWSLVGTGVQFASHMPDWFRNILADQLMHDSLAYGTVSCDTDFIVTDCVQVRAERSEECVVWGKAGSRGGGGGLTTSVQVFT